MLGRLLRCHIYRTTTYMRAGPLRNLDPAEQETNMAEIKADARQAEVPRAGGPVVHHTPPDKLKRLADFTTSARVLLISAIALGVGSGGVVAGVILLKLIRLCT